ncbi:60S ribosomal protein L24-like [Paramacrobiotus metropolitanus]|uniref:60S ribosomal protein L24-like n=1 Tax=Paramacrobiotus metropolitanus TaxID=2943436 RepID=UPI0024462EBB|nr:60S ribosomal protein L24-like [Paramacrobiotus metropolitanus]
MKTELCNFSGYKIHPGRGKRTVRTDGKLLNFLSSKTERAFLTLHRNPREIRWTVLYRRKYKKGQQEEVAKKRVRRQVKVQRAIAGASLTEITAKRNQKPEVRKAQRDEAIKAAKDKLRAKKTAKKVQQSAVLKEQQKKTAKPAKAVKTAPQRVGGKR